MGAPQVPHGASGTNTGWENARHGTVRNSRWLPELARQPVALTLSVRLLLGTRAKKADHRHCRLLRARRERPSGHAAEL